MTPVTLNTQSSRETSPKLPPVYADEVEGVSRMVLASLREHQVAPAPKNYAIWYEFHADSNPDLGRTMNVLLANHAHFDEVTMQDLYNNFLSSAKEEDAVREASMRALETLQDVIALADDGRSDVRKFNATLNSFAAESFGKTIDTLKASVEQLVLESRRMVGRTEYLGIRMRESSHKIHRLERDLECALQEATTDALTGVSNRKSFEQVIRRLAGEAMNSGDDLALLMVDIDHFKRFNDTWGHPLGDAVIRHVASLTRQTVRGGDFVARYGGEEFAVLLPNTSLEAAVGMAERIRAALWRNPFLADVEPPITPVTVSIGVSCYELGDALTEWVARSDNSLYVAKSNGRDCVMSAERIAFEC